MRAYLIICIIIALSMILCPIAAIGEGSQLPDNSETVAEEKPAESTGKAEKYISVMSSSTGNIEKVKMREYIIGSVAAEMSPLYHTEALKAQAVASYTYAKKIREQNEKHKDSSLGKADITDSPDTHQGYLDKKRRKEKWGDKFDEYEEKIGAAVDEVLGSFLTYDGETALAVYHSISAGLTQSAKSLWASDIPYLISVESPGDKLSPDFQSKKAFSAKEFKATAAECGVKLTGDPESWVEEITLDESGYAVSVRIGSKEISAVKFREKFGLRSLFFSIDCDGEDFIITCRGYGHGVGMSQYGADYMARQGSTWREILKHYYPATEIEAEKI